MISKHLHVENPMTQLLDDVIKKITQLPDAEQDALAALLIDELEDEQRWDESFAKSQDKLAAMSAKVDEDVRAGRVTDIGIDEL